jgi:hypothetical protein
VKLSEWADQQIYAYGPQPWARQLIVRTIGALNTGEDPVVFTTFDGATRDQPVATTRVLAALAAGLATARITSDPTHSEDAHLELVIVPWSTIVPTLRLEIAGDPEDHLPVVVTIGSETIEARHDQRPVLTAFYLEASRIAQS